MVNAFQTTHGMAKTPTYSIWQHIRQRCLNPTADDYELYGGRGIKICEAWNDFATFYADMGERPKGMSIERIDNNGDYTPENCKWATPREQASNRRTNRRISIGGETKTLTEWRNHYGIRDETVRFRLKRGWPIERALSEPVNLHHSHTRPIL